MDPQIIGMLNLKLPDFAAHFPVSKTADHENLPIWFKDRPASWQLNKEAVFSQASESSINSLGTKIGEMVLLRLE
jgi:hypothetical protein